MRRSLSATRTSKLCAIIRLLTVNRSVVTSPPSLRMQPSFVSRGTLHPSSLPHLPRPQSHRTRAAFLHHQPTDARHQSSSPSLLLTTFRASCLTTASFCAPESLPRSKTSPIQQKQELALDRTRGTHECSRRAAQLSARAMRSLFKRSLARSLLQGVSSLVPGRSCWLKVGLARHLPVVGELER